MKRFVCWFQFRSPFPPWKIFIFFLSFQLVTSSPQNFSNFGTDSTTDFGMVQIQPIGGMTARSIQKKSEVTTESSKNESPGKLGIGHGSPVSNNTRVPYQLYLDIKREDGTYQCGGVIISQKSALTAAHCVLNSEPKDILAYAGKLLDIDHGEVGQQNLTVSKVTVHPLYVGKGDQGVWDNDVAHLIFGSSIQFNHFVSSIPLPPVQNEEDPLGDQNFAGTTATATGWGLLPSETPLSQSELSPVLQAVDVTILSNFDCAKFRHYENVTANQICTSGTGGRSTCKGDSGGPLVITNFDFPDGEKGPLLIGITSFSIVGCGVSEYPSGYTRLSQYVQWIEEMEKENENLQFLAFKKEDRFWGVQNLIFVLKTKFYKIYKSFWAFFH